MTPLLVGGPRTGVASFDGRGPTRTGRGEFVVMCAIYDQILRDRAIFGRRFVALKFLSLETGRLPFPLPRPRAESGT